VGLRVVADVAFSPDSTTIGAASEGWRAEPGAVWIWDVASGTELHWLSIDDDTHFLAPAKRLTFAPDGTQVLMGLADGSILRWSLADASLAQELNLHSAAITALIYTPNGSGIMSASRDGSLRTWKADGTPVDHIETLGAISALTMSPDGSLVISGDEGGNIDMRHPDGSTVAHMRSTGGQIYALATSPDSTTLASASGDGSIRLWKLPSGEPSGELHGHSGPARSIAFSTDNNHIASAGSDGTLRLWRIASSAEERAVAVLQTDGISDSSLFQIAFSPDSNMIAVADSEGALSLWRSSDLTLIERQQIEGDAQAVSIAFLPDGTLIARTSAGQLYLWGGAGSTPKPILSPNILNVATLPNNTLATLSGDILQIWRGPSNAPERYADAAAPGFTSIAPGPKSIVLGSRRGAVEMWSVQ
ncbi:MAG: WD40 repeat domain-containing protein, partial [Oscillochloris sp.]|nr:WD40 repeat domain-containing protein [Oscillochloris sp.]